MSEPEHVFERLAREQQATALGVLVWWVMPLCLVASLVAVLTGGATRHFVVGAVGSAGVLLVSLVQRWRGARQRHRLRSR